MVIFKYASPALHDPVGLSTGSDTGGLIGADTGHADVGGLIVADTGQADVGGLIGADKNQADVGGLIGADTGQLDVGELIGAIVGPRANPIVTLAYAETAEVLVELTLIIR